MQDSDQDSVQESVKDSDRELEQDSDQQSVKDSVQDSVPELSGSLHQLHHEAVPQELPVLRKKGECSQKINRICHRDVNSQQIVTSLSKSMLRI